MISNNQFKIFAHYYYSMGFNVTCISNEVTDYNFISKEILKTPNHKSAHLLTNRETIDELLTFDWENAIGIGAILGESEIRCIDIDGVTDSSVIGEILSIMELPKNYEWVVQTGTGYHIFIKTDFHQYPLQPGQVKAFYPNNKFAGKFKTLELRWKYHVVLPPSTHPNYKRYAFVDSLPSKLPVQLDLNLVYKTLREVCDNSKIVTAEDMSGNYCYYPESNNRSNPSDSDGDRVFLIFDTEVNGLPTDRNLSSSNYMNWPELIQLSWYLFTENGYLIEKKNHIIYRPNIVLKPEIQKLTNITEQDLKDFIATSSIVEALDDFEDALKKATYIISHNLDFDKKTVSAEFMKAARTNLIESKSGICTMMSSIEFCSLDNKKWPTLKELYKCLFDDEIEIKHNSIDDAKIVSKCFWELVFRGLIVLN